MLTHASPQVRARRKSVDSDAGEQRALALACWLWRGVQTWIPVVWQRRVIGHVKGDPARSRTLWTTQTPPFTDQDTMVAKLSSGQQWGQIFWKPISTNVVIENWHDAWGTDGSPQMGNWSGTARTARQFLNTTTGAMYHGGAVSPLKKYLLRASFQNGETTAMARIVYDRVLSYDACTMTAGSQSMTNTLAATRYISTNDPGLRIFIEADTVHNATAANLTTLAYTDQSGNTGHTVPTTPTLVKIPSIVAPTSILGARGVLDSPGNTTRNLCSAYLQLAAGDQGVRKLENYQWSAAPTGTCSFVLQFPLCLLPDVSTAGQTTDHIFTDGLESVNKQIYDDACLSFLYSPLVSAQPAMTHGWLQFGWE